MKNTQIEFLRRKEKMSQEQLADKLKISRQTISEWERGITYPSVEKLIELSNIFNVSLDFLIKGETFKETKQNEDNFLHYASYKNTKGQVIGKKNGLVASIPLDKHIGNSIIIGGCGSGKTRTYLIPNILKAIEREESIIVIDHLNEIQEVLKEKLTTYNINTFDFMNSKNSTSINISSELKCNDIISDKYIEVLYKSFFDNIKNTTHFELFKLLITEKIKNPSFNLLGLTKEDFINLINSIPEDTIERKYFRNINVKDTLFELIYDINNLFKNKDIVKILTEGQLELKDLLKPKTITFINPNFFDSQNGKLLSAILNLFFTKIILKDIKVDSHVNVFLDEYGNLSKNFNIVNNISYLNKNINISILIQSLNQLNYDSNNVLNNFRNFIYMGSFNMKDLSTLADFFELPIKDLRDLRNQLIYKREFEQAVVLNKIFDAI